MLLYKETSSTTGWNHYIFYHTILESAKMFFLPVHTHFIQAYVVWNARIYSKRPSECCANWIALSVKGIYCITAFLKTTFKWSTGKNNPDFVQPLMAFCYSNICYYVILCHRNLLATCSLLVYWHSGQVPPLCMDLVSIPGWIFNGHLKYTNF